jgi:hypothetical protein
MVQKKGSIQEYKHRILIMKSKRRLLHCIWILGLLLITNSSFGKKVTTKEFLEEHNNGNQSFIESFDKLLEEIKPKEDILNEKIKSELNDEQPLILIEGEKSFPSPCNLHKFNLDGGKYTLELISLGKMAGFKKTIMLPLIKVYNKHGKLIENIIATKYETRAPTGRLPFHIYSLWELNIDTDDVYFIQIASDNSSTDDIDLILQTGVGAVGIISNSLLNGYPVKKSPFGKYKMILNK